MADASDNAYGNENGRTPSPRREEPPAEYREPRENRDSRDNRDDRQQPRENVDYRPPARGGDASVNPGNNLHVRGLAMRTTEKDLEEIFGQFGAIEKAQVMRDPRSRESRGFAFVTFVDPAAAEEAISALNGTTLDERTIVVEKAKRGRARTPTPGQYQGPDKGRDFSRGAPGGGFGGRDYPPRRFDDRDDRRGGSGSGYAQPMRGGGDRDRESRRDDRPRRDYDDRAPRKDYGDRPPRRDRDYDDRPPRRDRDDAPRRRDDRDEPRRY